MRILRSVLFVPGNRSRMLAKAPTLDADAFIIDLEDSVPAAEKVATRPLVRQAVDDFIAAGRMQVYVRVNPLDSKTAFSRGVGLQDLAAVICANLAGIILPKTETAAEVIAVDRHIADLEMAQGIPVGQIEVCPILETAKGILNAREIAEARPRRVPRLSIGPADLTNDLGIEWTRDEAELQVARSLVVLASRAAGIEPPIDGIYADVSDREGLLHSALRARQLGFQGKQCIHPDQIGPLNKAFAPTPRQIDYAGRSVAAFDEAVQSGKASLLFEGKMLDYPVIERQRQLLATVDRMNEGID